MILLFLATFISLAMLIWFKTDILVDWFGLYEKELLKERINWLPDGLDFPSFLKMYKPSFWTKLLGCPLCFSWWLSVLFMITGCILTGQLGLIFLTPALCLISLFIYGVITKLVKIS